MSRDEKSLKVARCPCCYMKDIDEFLTYDDQDGVYYCRKCYFEGTAEEIRDYFDMYLPKKYKDMNKPHHFQYEDSQ